MTKQESQPTQQAMYDASRKRRVGKRRNRDHGEDITYLNITPMLDMMTILLVFLIKSFASSSADVNVANLTLPHSTTKLEISEALQLMITPNEILLDQKVVTQLTNGTINAEDLPEGANGYLIKPLYDVLSSRADYFKKIEEFGGSQFVGKVAVIADKTISYKTLFKLFVQKPKA